MGVAKVLSEEALYREASAKVTLVMDMMLPPTLTEEGRVTEWSFLKLDYVQISCSVLFNFRNVCSLLAAKQKAHRVDGGHVSNLKRTDSELLDLQTRMGSVVQARECLKL